MRIFFSSSFLLLEMTMVTQVQTLDEAVYISHSTSTIKKSMYPDIHLPGKNK